MKDKAIPAFLAAAVFAASHAKAEAGPDPWVAMAQRDLRAMHDLIRDNHPGPVDPENPHYRDWLETGLAVASKEAARARTYSDYTRALRRYTNGFQDGHLNVFFNVTASKLDWPGFVAGQGAGDGPEVIYAEQNAGVKVGDRIEGCDGQSLDALMKARVDPYFWNTAIPHVRLQQANALFVANPDEAGRRPKACRFSSGEVRLNWRPGEATEVYKTVQRAVSGAAEFGIKQVDGVWFVRLPRFWLMSDADLPKLEGIVAELRAKAPDLRKGPVVFDVRGNGGGNSLWGERIAVALWGEPMVNRVEEGFDGTLDFRVSAANIKKLSDIVDIVKKDGFSETLDYWSNALAAMRAAQAAGKPYARMEDTHPPPSGPAPANPVSGRVFLLTDPGCGSACLDFADLMLHLPGVTQIGRPTYADAVYIDNNEILLPSGLASLDYGMKVYRHRLRANNQWYDPKYRWPGGPMTDEALARWVRSLPP